MHDINSPKALATTVHLHFVSNKLVNYSQRKVGTKVIIITVFSFICYLSLSLFCSRTKVYEKTIKSYIIAFFYFWIQKKYGEKKYWDGIIVHFVLWQHISQIKLSAYFFFFEEKEDPTTIKDFVFSLDYPIKIVPRFKQAVCLSSKILKMENSKTCL